MPLLGMIVELWQIFLDDVYSLQAATPLGERVERGSNILSCEITRCERGESAKTLILHYVSRFALKIHFSTGNSSSTRLIHDHSYSAASHMKKQ